MKNMTKAEKRKYELGKYRIIMEKGINKVDPEKLGEQDMDSSFNKHRGDFQKLVEITSRKGNKRSK